MSAPDPAALLVSRDRIRRQWLRPEGERPASSARGLHHAALVSGDVAAGVEYAVAVTVAFACAPTMRAGTEASAGTRWTQRSEAP